MSFTHEQTHRFVRTRPSAGKLPSSKFGVLVGSFGHATLVPEGSSRPDNNHIYLWVTIPNGEFTGSYECAFNIHSTDASNVLFTDQEEDLTGQTLPQSGFKVTSLSYTDLGVKDADFVAIQQGDLQSIVTHYAETCDQMAAYGMTYPDGTGLHDIHMNSGEPAGSAHPERVGQDGALVFYFQGGAQDQPRPYARWVLIRFDTQHLPS